MKTIVLTSLLGLLFAGPLQAQGIEDRTAHQRFACLQRERALEPLAEKTPDKENTGLVRLKLRFSSPEKPPKVEVLQGKVDDDMLRIAKRYVEGYRLPCLHEKDHPVEVVQEFAFNRWGTEPPVPLAGADQVLVSQIQRPAKAFAPSDVVPWVPGKLLVDFSFHAGREEPEVKVVFNGVNRYLERDAVAYVRSYRLKDSSAVAYPYVGRQEFHFRVEGADGEVHKGQFRLKRDSFRLTEFLGMTKNFRELPVDLDLDTMACPFAVRLQLRQPYESNQVSELGVTEANPNRAYLLDWLSKLQVNFGKEAVQKDLFGTDLRIEVPCGRLNLLSAAAG